MKKSDGLQVAVKPDDVCLVHVDVSPAELSGWTFMSVICSKLILHLRPITCLDDAI
jgi:hypothetical protein